MEVATNAFFMTVKRIWIWNSALVCYEKNACSQPCHLIAKSHLQIANSTFPNRQLHFILWNGQILSKLPKIIFLQVALCLKFIPFLLKFMPQIRRSYNFHLLINSKKGSIFFFLILGINFDGSFIFLPSASRVLFTIFSEQFESFQLKFYVVFYPL